MIKEEKELLIKQRKDREMGVFPIFQRLKYDD